MPTELDVRRYITDDAFCSSENYMSAMRNIDEYLRNGCSDLSAVTVFVNRLGLPTFLYTDPKSLNDVTVPWKSIVGETIASGDTICADVRNDEERYVYPKQKQGQRIHYYRKPAKETNRRIDIIQSVPLVVYGRKPFGCVQFLLDDIPTPESQNLYQVVARSIAPATYEYEKDWITSRVMHALKNLAAEVTGFSDSMQRHVIPKRNRIIPNDVLSAYPELAKVLENEEEYLGYVARAAETIKHVSERYSKLTIGQMPEFNETDVGEMIGELKEKTAALSHYHGSNLLVETSIPESLPKTLWDREMVLNELLFNLVKNASEALAERPTDRRISIRVEEYDGRMKISVKDNAGGVSDPKKLFDGESTKGFGRGIGLLSAQQAAKYHEGSISYTSITEENEPGSLFVVDLPKKPTIAEYSLTS